MKVIAHAKGERFEQDPHRLEKISNIVKQFKLSCSKMAAMFTSMCVRNSHFAALIALFTATTFIMLIHTDPSIRTFAFVTYVRLD